MAHDVFISYSVKDKGVADAVCATLESGGLRCWIAPRDVKPGGTWAEEIVQAIGSSRVLVLVFSSHSDNSEMVNRELDIATDCRLAIIPFRIEDVIPSGETRFYLAGKHWLDAMTPPLEQHLKTLVAALQPLVHLVGPREEDEMPAERGERLSGSGEKNAATLGKPESAAAAAPARSLRIEPQAPPVIDAKSGRRRFKLKRWHYLVSVPVIWLIIILLVGYLFFRGTAQEAKGVAKIVSVKGFIMDAELALLDGNFTHAISNYEMAMREKIDPERSSELHTKIQSGLADAYYRRGMKLQGQGEFKKALEDLEKSATLGGVAVDPAFLADLKKAAAAPQRTPAKKNYPGPQPR